MNRNDILKEIWNGDKLSRRDESRMLERFLTDESKALVRLNRDSAFVLALDAQYGEGKSWFLSRFRRQLETRYPVAFVDAWVDDANREPLVSLIAALDDALRPYFGSRKIQDTFGAMARAALPIMGKAVIGAGGKLISKYIGDEFGDEAKALVGVARDEQGKGDDWLEPGVDAITASVSDLVDGAGKALLEQYRSRQRSRDTFKKNLRELAKSISKSSASDHFSPIFIIIDELDRCRPSYAISLLEEIKHLFDVPGVIFVIALHGEQLSKSVNAVYGAEFDSKAYLRRFFSRHYSLRRLSIAELVVSKFSEVLTGSVEFSYPTVLVDGIGVDMEAAVVAGHILSEWGVTPREAVSIIDGVRLFISSWDIKDVPVELPLLLILMVNLIRGNEVSPDPVGRRMSEIRFHVPQAPIYDGDIVGVAASDMFVAYQIGLGHPLPEIISMRDEHGPEAYVRQRMLQEYSVRFHSSHEPGNPPFSSWSGYRQRLLQMAPFIIGDDSD